MGYFMTLIYTLFTFWEICACTKKVINRRDSIDAYLFTKLGRIKFFFIKFTKKKILQNFHYEWINVEI